jgi:GAF domain-containing protein
MRGEQAARRRVATLVARGAAPGMVVAAVAAEAGHVLPDADFTMVGRYRPDRTVEVAGGWSRTGSHLLVGRRSPLGGRNLSMLAFETGQTACVDFLADDEAVIVAAREMGMRSAAGAPISAGARLWGVMIAASARENALPSGTEQLEALANAAKHAAASAVHVGADAAGDVRDDGGADPARGSGLAGLKDRVEAIGGTWSVRNRPGEGTTLLAELPARPGQSSPANRPG